MPRCRAPWLRNHECRDNNLGRSQAFADGVFGKFGNTPDLQFNHDLLEMGFHGFDANVQAVADFGGDFTFGEELQYFPLSG